MPVSEEYGLGLGSSPLSRGIRPCCQICGNGGRIIPALAGNTIDSLHHLCPISDHPRSRGEYDSYGDVVVKGAGSSPLSRGIPVGFARSPDTARIIPALAGNTVTPTPTTARKTDHPRSRGEYTSAKSRDKSCTGSSPLSRGILEWFGAFVKAGRIIPALAGNTNCHCSAKSIVSDHPRSRGEYSTSAVAAARTDGSSPLSRGILHECRGCCPD